MARLIHTLSDDHSWNRVPGVTLLGHAAHRLPPNGEGANLAMLDGAELAQAIVANPDDKEAAFAAYEGKLFPRSAAVAPDMHEILDLMLGEKAPFSLIAFFNREGVDQTEVHGRLFVGVAQATACQLQQAEQNSSLPKRGRV